MKKSLPAHAISFLIGNIFELAGSYLNSNKKCYQLIVLLFLSILLGFNRLQAQTSETITTTGTWICPQGVTTITVECWAGGGAGGAATGNPAAGGGGAGGAYAKSTSISVVPGTSYTVTIGAGGIGNNTGNGGAGGSSWFNSTSTIFAVGGAGGNGALSNNNTANGATAANSGNVGTINFYGGNGGTGGGSAGAQGGGGGEGAGSAIDGEDASGMTEGDSTNGGGNGATGSTNSANGASATETGGGGAGARAGSGADRTGGNGAAGRVVITIPSAIWNNAITGTNPNNNNPYTTGDNVASNLTVSGITRGNGLNGQNQNNRFTASNWSTNGTINNNDYFEFTLTPASGYSIHFTSFAYTGQVSAGSPSFVFRSSIDSYTANIGTPTTSGTSISLSASAYQNITSAITFRFYGYNMAAGATQYSINDFIFTGSVVPVTTITSLGSASACAGSSANVVINGQNFTGATNVSFNGTSALFTVNSNTQITATLPNGATTGPVTVTTPNNTATSASTFTVNSRPTGVISGTASICSGASTNLSLAVTGSGTISGTINPGGIPFSGTAPTITLSVTPGSTTTYTIVSLSDANCTATSSDLSGSAVVTISSPTGTASANGPVCSGGTIQLTGTASGATTFAWTGPNGFTSSQQNPSITGAASAHQGSYYFTASNGSCSAITSVVFVPVHTFPSVSAASSVTSGCAGVTSNLTATHSNPGYTVYEEKFNGSTSGWTTQNNSTGGTPADAAWTLRTSTYTYVYYFLGFIPVNFNFASNDNSVFYMSNSDDQGTGSATETYLQSPAFSTVGYNTLNLSFYHHFNELVGNDFGYVQVSTNGTSWTDVQTYSTDQGGATNFAQSTINLNAYVGNSTVYIRFKFVADWGWWWAIDNVSVTGTTNYNYAWTSSPSGFSSSVQNPAGVVTNASTTYQVQLSNAFGCTSTSSASVVIGGGLSGTLSGGGTVCPGGSASVSIAVTGTGPWSGTLSNGTAFSGSSSPIVVSLSPSGTTSYTIATLTNGSCSASSSSLSGSATINVNPRPTAVISGGGNICAGGSSAISISLTGTGPWNGALSDGTSFSGSTSPIVVNLSPSITTTYTVATLSDANCNSISSDLTGLATITINASPTASIAATSAICSGSAGIVTFTGAPWSVVTYNVNGGLEEGVLIMGSGTVSIGTGPLSSNTTYNLVSADDGTCSVSVSGSATIAMSNPVVVVSSTTAVCPGSSAMVDFNGTPGAIVQYAISGDQDFITLDGTGHAAVNSGSVYASYLDYTLMSVTEGTCTAPASGTATISTTTMPEAIVSGDASLCFGGATLIEFNGTPGATITYRIDGGADHTLLLDSDGYGSVGTGALSASISFELVSVSVGACLQNISSEVFVEIISNNYYQDMDGDGFGDAAVPQTNCTQPVGYVENDLDCDDTNSDINPSTVWYADVDGDGFGSYIYMTQCDDPGLSGVILQGGDCNDNDPLILDDCSGIPNDNWSNASPVTGSLNAYPACSLINGTCFNASVSPQGNPSNVASGAGRDVWYKFTAPSTAVRIRVMPTGFDAVIELQNSTSVEMDVENIDPSIGGDEIMNIGGLTRGEQYWVGIRNYQNTDGGEFTVCISPLMDTRCDDGPGTYPLCTNFKPDYTGAVNYTFHFDPTGSTPGFSSAGTHSSQIPLNTPLDLRYGGTYDVMIDANYTNLTDGLGNPEPISVQAIDVCPIVISAQPDLQIKETQRCPAHLLRATRLAAKPFVCGPVLFYEYEFTEMDCNTQISSGISFTKNTAGASANLPLNFSAPALMPGSCYSVRVRPVFTHGNGSYGTAHCIQMGNVASQPGGEDEMAEDPNYIEHSIEANLYPNPNEGNRVTVTLTEVKDSEVLIRITDALGRMIYTKQYQVEGQLLTTISLEDKVKKGLYLVEFVADNKIITKRLIIE
ncbi:MAG: T9SS type A sorting domain-containing protein [Flavobacteriales bacterium]